jgi:SAM-dependent methyltransferase
MQSHHASLQNVLRQFKLLQLAEDIRFLMHWLQHASAIRRFRQEYPDFPIPPPDLAFDAYNTLNFQGYRQYGLQVAQFIYSLIETYGSHPDGDILEWGCGPARIIRHFPTLVPLGHGQVIGVDYNRRSIQWCHQHIPGVHFLPNNLIPPLPFPTNHFRAVYAVSVFTHLSADSAHLWSNELHRILRPGGVAVATLHGDRCQGQLLPSEQQVYATTGIVVRGEIQEGKKLSLAFHNPTYARTVLFRDFEVVHHEQGTPSTTRNLQDVWVLKKPYNDLSPDLAGRL